VVELSSATTHQEGTGFRWVLSVYGSSNKQGSGDRDQEEEENEVEVQDSQRHIRSSSFIPQRITRRKAKDLGSRL